PSLAASAAAPCSTRARLSRGAILERGGTRERSTPQAPTPAPPHPAHGVDHRDRAGGRATACACTRGRCTRADSTRRHPGQFAVLRGGGQRPSGVGPASSYGALV